MAKIVSALLVFSAVAIFLVKANGYGNFGGHQPGLQHGDFIHEGNHGVVHTPVKIPQEESSSWGQGEDHNAMGSIHVSNGVSEKQTGSVSKESSSGHEQFGGEEESSMSIGGHESQGGQGPPMHHNSGGWNGGYHGRH